MNRRIIVFAMVSFALVGCVETRSIPASEPVTWQESTPIPAELSDQIEADIRQLVRKLHRSGSQTALEEGDALDQYQLEAKPLNSGETVRDRYTGEYLRCSEVLVSTKLNYTKIQYKHAAQLAYARNNDLVKRIDRICTFEDSGREQYIARAVPLR